MELIVLSFPYDVLLVEDNDDDRRLFHSALVTTGLSGRLHEVTDGEEALDFVFKRGNHSGAPTPDVIVLDLDLPKIPGREVLRQVKADAALRSIPVIVLSSSAHSANDCYDLGANAFVSKPDHVGSFPEVVGRLERFWFNVAVLPRSARSFEAAFGL